MPIIVVGAEKNFAALRPRLFAGGKVSSKAAGEVRAAIRKANPHADLDKLAPGTVLIVPESPKVRVRGELSLDEATANAIEGVTAFGKNALGDLADAAATSEARAREERRRVLRSLDAAGSQTRRDRRLAKELEAARSALAAEDDSAKERAAQLEKAQAEWASGLDALKQLLG